MDKKNKRSRRQTTSQPRPTGSFNAALSTAMMRWTAAARNGPPLPLLWTGKTLGEILRTRMGKCTRRLYIYIRYNSIIICIGDNPPRRVFIII